MKVLKIIFRTLGIAFFLGGLFYFLEAISSIAETSHIPTLLVRFVNGVAWLIAGYGLVRLREWAVYAIGGMATLHLLTVFYNQYVSNVAPAGLGPFGFLIILFFVAFSLKEKLFEKEEKKK